MRLNANGGIASSGVETLTEDKRALAQSMADDTARRLARLFGTTDAFWLNLQQRYDLQTAPTPPELAEIEPMIPA